MINYSQFLKQFISPLESKLMKKRQNIKKCHFKAFFSSKKNAKKRHHGVLPMYAHFAPLKNANFASKNLQNRSFQIIKSIISNHQINHFKSSNQSSQIIILIIPNYQINQLNFQSKSFYFKSSKIKINSPKINYFNWKTLKIAISPLKTAQKKVKTWVPTHVCMFCTYWFPL